jgi:bifunctional DNase/RNase
MWAPSPVTSFYVLPFVVAASAGLVVTAAPPTAARQEPVEMEVLGVVPLESEMASLLVLQEKGAATVLPIFVGRSEGTAIRQRLNQAAPARPAAADLLHKTIESLGGKVLRVEIRGAHAALFRAVVSLQQADRRIEVEARPSDSVALAMSTHAPIFATREVMAEAGLTKQDLERMHTLPSGGEEESAAPGPVTTF